ncbi:MAG: chorismate mutase [Spirochaetaceae bacterium]|nr:chorismate mutase [Spirochaetaceae bacterium]
MKRLSALRGAFRCRNDRDDIIAQTAALYDALLERNGLVEGDIVSLQFSVTADLDAINPCAALRRSGRGGELALFAQTEPVFRESLDRVVRALLLCYREEGSGPVHVYQNGAEVLRPDRAHHPALPDG